MCLKKNHVPSPKPPLYPFPPSNPPKSMIHCFQTRSNLPLTCFPWVFAMLHGETAIFHPRKIPQAIGACTGTGTTWAALRPLRGLRLMTCRSWAWRGHRCQNIYVIRKLLGDFWLVKYDEYMMNIYILTCKYGYIQIDAMYNMLDKYRY